MYVFKELVLPKMACSDDPPEIRGHLIQSSFVCLVEHHEASPPRTGIRPVSIPNRRDLSNASGYNITGPILAQV